eukprot:Rmarinus@m.27292
MTRFEEAYQEERIAQAILRFREREYEVVRSSSGADTFPPLEFLTESRLLAKKQLAESEGEQDEGGRYGAAVKSFSQYVGLQEQIGGQKKVVMTELCRESYVDLHRWAAVSSSRNAPASPLGSEKGLECWWGELETMHSRTKADKTIEAEDCEVLAGFSEDAECFDVVPFFDLTRTSPRMPCGASINNSTCSATCDETLEGSSGHNRNTTAEPRDDCYGAPDALARDASGLLGLDFWTRRSRRHYRVSVRLSGTVLCQNESEYIIEDTGGPSSTRERSACSPEDGDAGHDAEVSANRTLSGNKVLLTVDPAVCGIATSWDELFEKHPSAKGFVREVLWPAIDASL